MASRHEAAGGRREKRERKVERRRKGEGRGRQWRGDGHGKTVESGWRWKGSKEGMEGV